MGPGDVGQRRSQFAQRLEHLHALVDVADVDAADDQARLVVDRLGQARIGGHRDPDGHRGDLVGRVGDVIPPARQDLGRVARRVEDAGEGHDRAERVGVELEVGHDAEVAAASAQRPEQVRVVVGGRHMDRTVGTHDRRRAEAVDGEPVLAPHPTLAASEGEAADAGLGDHAAGHDEAERLRFAVDVSPHRAALHGGSPRDRVDGDGAHPREVDDHAAVAARQTGDGVPAASHRDQQVPLAGEVDRVDDVGGTGGSHLQRRAPVVHRVVDRIGVKTVVGRREHVTPKAGTQLLELVVFDLGLATVQRGNQDCHRDVPRSLTATCRRGPSATAGHCVSREGRRPRAIAAESPFGILPADFRHAER